MSEQNPFYEDIVCSRQITPPRMLGSNALVQSDRYCHLCYERGHLAANCPVREALLHLVRRE